MAHKRKVRRTKRLPAPAVRRPAATKADGEREAANHAAAKTVSDQVATSARTRVDVTGGDERGFGHRDLG